MQSQISGMMAKMHPERGVIWFYKDHLGSNRQVGVGEMVRDYYPYGEAYAAAGDETAYRFSGKELDKSSELYYFGSRYYNPYIARWLVPDPAGQGWSPYMYCGNSPMMMVDPDGEFAWWIPMITGAPFNSFSHARDINNFGEFLGFAGIGALGGAISMLGHTSAFYGLQNIITGAGQGAIVGGLNAALAANNWNAFGEGAMSGAKSGAVFGLATTEQFKNTIKGNFWLSDQQVFEKFKNAGNFQGALDYFGGKGIYDPDHHYFKTNPTAKACLNTKTNEIIYSDRAFTTTGSEFKSIIYHENVHRSGFLSGKALSTIDAEEVRAWEITYKNQGLFPGHNTDITSRINYYGMNSGKYKLGVTPFGPIDTLFKSKWWHIIYKAPRRYGTF